MVGGAFRRRLQLLKLPRLECVGSVPSCGTFQPMAVPSAGHIARRRSGMGLFGVGWSRRRNDDQAETAAESIQHSTAFNRGLLSSYISSVHAVLPRRIESPAFARLRIATRLSGHLGPDGRPANRDSDAGSAGGGASSGLVDGPSDCGDAMVRGRGGGVSTVEGQCAAWRGSSVRSPGSGAAGRVPANPNALSVMRMLTTSHSRILISNVLTWKHLDTPSVARVSHARTNFRAPDMGARIYATRMLRKEHQVCPGSETRPRCAFLRVPASATCPQ